MHWHKVNNEKKKLKQVFVPRKVAELIWASSIGKSEVRFGKENFCVSCE